LGAREDATMAKYQVQVRASEWAGRLTNMRWVPAVDGTYNATGQDAEEASTFDTLEEAETVAERMGVLESTEFEVDFRVVEVAS
jgi:hypothetical protein